MKTRVPAAVAAIAVLTLAGATVPREIRTQQVPLVDTVAVAQGGFSYRLPGEYLADGRPVDAPVIAETSSGFEIMKYQVSAGEYAMCVAAGACEEPEGGKAANPDLPVTGVSFRDATAYADWLSASSGSIWRLPTDSEWAFAAGDRWKDLSFDGDDDGSNPSVRWLASYRSEAGSGPRDPEPKPRGSFGVNAKGLADVGGNVWEWTSTCYDRVSAGEKASTTQNCGVRTVEGKHRGYMSFFIRDGKSGGCAAGVAPDNLGIRLVREPDTLVSRLKRLIRVPYAA